MLKDNKLPGNSVDLIEQLDAMFPPRCIHMGESIEDHVRYAGKCDLIQFLKRVRDDAHAKSPTDKIIR